MRKSDLVKGLMKDMPKYNQAKVEDIIKTIFDEITDALKDGGRVEIRGFGAFTVRERAARVGSDPRTGEKLNIPARRIPYFRAGKDMLETLNKK